MKMKYTFRHHENQFLTLSAAQVPMLHLELDSFRLRQMSLVALAGL
jgi:hypothetical protein